MLPAPHSKKYYETACPEGGLGFQVCSGRLPFLNRFPFEESANVSVVIRMKRMGRKNRAFYRICATDKRSPRDGRLIEEIGTYDPLIPDTDARCTLNGERLQHWLSVGALPSDAVRVLIKKYGPAGTHLAAMEQARVKLSMPSIRCSCDPCFTTDYRMHFESVRRLACRFRPRSDQCQKKSR